jgi:3-deoxy-D-manno-octulosonic-acid transferase
MFERIFPRLEINPEKPILWFHCASVGEFNTAKPILRPLKRDFFILLTYFSPRAREFLKTQGSFYDALHPLPLDNPLSVKLFERQANPYALLIMERELWYFLLKGVKAKKVLLNAYAKGGFLERSLAMHFDLILCRTEKDRETFEGYGVNAIACGNLKVVLEREEKGVSLPLREGKTIMAGSFHPQEIPFLKEFYGGLLKEMGEVNLVVVPRHISKVDVFMREFREFKPCLKSGNREDCQVIVVDSLGELFYLYALGDLALVGGTFAKGVGGHNLLEPAYHRKFVLFGPYTHKVRDLEEFILSKDLGFNVTSPQEAVVLAKKVLEGRLAYPDFNLQDFAKQVKECYLSNLYKILSDAR